MREIKFRGVSLKTKEFVYGFYTYSASQTGFYIIEFVELPMSMSDPLGDQHDEWHPVDPKTVGQYTGLKDKNGKEIYEGDIPKSYSSEKHPIEYGEYSFEDNDGQCSIEEKKIGWHYGENEFSTIYGDWDIEIIGNIHDL